MDVVAIMVPDLAPDLARDRLRGGSNVVVMSPVKTTDTVHVHVRLLDAPFMICEH